MLNINKTKTGAALTVALAGRLDTTTAPELESELKGSLDGVEELEMDLTELEYISSAGLRVLLSAQKLMMKQGSMKVTHVNETVMEIFEVTGFVDILTIE
jgi:anti-sigma B factor antagonist